MPICYKTMDINQKIINNNGGNSMSKLKLGVLLILTALSIAAVGSAALSSVSFDRSVNSGQVMVDTDQNVAIQISNSSKYAGLVKTDTDGKVIFNLNEAINNNTSSGFNTDSVFTIGTLSSGAIKIKNNSDVAITLTMVNDVNSNNALTLSPTNGSSSTIGAGASSDFYFTINTNGQDALKTMKAVLHVQGQ